MQETGATELVLIDYGTWLDARMAGMDIETAGRKAAKKSGVVVPLGTTIDQFAGFYVDPAIRAISPDIHGLIQSVKELGLRVYPQTERIAA